MRFLFRLDLIFHIGAGKKIWNFEFGNKHGAKQSEAIARRRHNNHQDVQLPETGLQEISQSSDARSIGDVQLMEKDVGEPLLPEPLGGRRAPRLVPGRQDDGDAGDGELPAHLQPDPLVAAGDHGDPAATATTNSVLRLT